VAVRQWTEEYGGRFLSGPTEDGSGIREFRLRLGDFPRSEEVAIHAGLPDGADEIVSHAHMTNRHSEKTLAFRFVALDLITQLTIAKELGMDVDRLRGLNMSEFRDAVVSYAANAERMHDFWRLVAAATADQGPMGDNPF
jgi:hypothetical protein